MSTKAGGIKFFVLFLKRKYFGVLDNSGIITPVCLIFIGQFKKTVFNQQLIKLQILINLF